ncbi:hypothetical protein HDU93_004833 [Gonapodya sp. JEL0774]|nr:hypothetical protein HDU93_004833 [Gonapodya sp. JEL0774]
MAPSPSYDWNLSLPYLSKKEHDEEVSTFLYNIKSGLSTSLLARDYAPGGLHWLKQLERFLDLKFPLPQDDRVKLINALYHVVVTPKMDPHIIERYADGCRRLLANEEILPSGAMEIDWSPLWEVIKGAILVKQRERSSGANPIHLQAVTKLVKEARRFFDPSSTLPILSVILPYYTHHNIFTVMIVQKLNEVPEAQKYPFYWLPTVFDLLSITPTLPQGALLDLLARLAQDQVAKPGLVGWTKDDVSVIMAAAVREMDLPVGSGPNVSRGGGGQGAGLARFFAGMMGRGGGFGGGSGTGGGMGGDGGDRFESLARFLVYLIYPVSSTASTSPESPDHAPQVPELGVLGHIKTVLHAIESYYHPSNIGVWTRGLNKLLHYLSREFLSRWRAERSLNCATPTHLRLTREIRDDFAEAIRVPAFLAIFGKDPVAVADACSAVKCLAWLAPKIVLPPLIEILSSSIASTESTHRVIAAIGVLSHIAPALVSRSHFPQGATHLLQFLEATLPGLDINDITKSQATLTFICHVALYVPFADATKVTPPPTRAPSEALQGVSLVEGTEGDFMTVDVETRTARTSSGDSEWDEEDFTEADQLVRESTVGFEDWLIKFLEQVFKMLDNLPQNFHTSTRQTVESNVIQMLLHTVELVFSQLSPELHRIALERVYRFASGSVITNATKCIGVISSLTSAGWGAEQMLAKFLPTALQMITAEMESGAGSKWSPANEPMPSDFTLHWWQSISYHIVQNVGPAILRHKELLDDLIDRSINRSVSARAYRWSAKLLRYIILSLTGTYPNELNSLNPSQWNDLGFAAVSWGDTPEPVDVNLNWHQPTMEEVQWAHALIRKWSTVAIEKLQKMMADTSENSRSQSFGQEFVKWLVVLRNVAQGLSFIHRKTGFVQKSSPDVGTPQTELMLAANYVLEDTDVESVIETIGETFHTIAAWSQNARTDDTELAKAIIKAIKVYSSDRGIDRTKYSNILKGWRYQKSLLKVVERHWEYPRYLLGMRMFLQHLNRMRVNAMLVPLTTTSITLMEDLANMSLVRYSDVRLALFRLIPKYLEALRKRGDEREEEMSDRIKGALQMLNTGIFRRVYVRDWLSRKEFMRALMQSQHIEKPQLQDLVRKVFLEFLAENSTLSLEAPPLSGKGTMAYEGITEDKAVIKASICEKVLERESNNRLIKNELVRSSELVRLLGETKLHWRIKSMGLVFLELELREDDPISLKTVEILLESVVSDVEAIRKAALPATARLLYLLKKRAGVVVGGRSISVEITKHLDDTIRTQPHWTEDYLKMGLQQATESDMSLFHYSDKTRSGWYCWPDTLKVYGSAGRSRSTRLPYIDPLSQDAALYLEKTFSDPAFWSKFSNFMAQEATGRDGFEVADNFSGITSRFYKSVFQLFEDRFLDSVRPTIVSLASEYQDKNKQRTVAELLGGLIRGSKHWAWESLAAMWAWVARASRHPYKQVRDAIGATLNELTQIRWSVSASSPSALLKRNLVMRSSDSPLGAPTILDNEMQSIILELVSQFSDWRITAQAQRTSGYVGPTDYANAAKTGDVLNWQLAAFGGIRMSGTYPYIQSLIPQTFLAQDFDDKDLQDLATSALTLYSRLPLPKELVSTALSALTEQTRAAQSWHIRSRTLPVLQVIVFRQLNLLDVDQVNEVMNAVSALLEDIQLEVRSLAAVTLSGILRLITASSIEMLEQKFTATLKRTDIPRGRSGNPPPGRLVERHAAVLGLSSIVQAFPYTVPDFVPNILVKLANTIGEPAPVGATAKKALADFKRTHHDTWHDDVKK